MHPAHLPMKVLIACEYSGIVRRAFDRLGHDVWSCDLRQAEDRSNRHITGDVRDILDWGWDLLVVAHPPCTRLCNSGVRWLIEPPTKLNPAHHTPEECAAYLTWDRWHRLDFMWLQLQLGADLFSDLWNADVPRIAVENPVMHEHAKARIRNYAEFAQSVQPWQYGDFETKRTCLWLRGLDPLVPQFTTVSDAARALGLPNDAKPRDRVHKMSPGKDRDKERSRFFEGIASAMAEQWGGQALAAWSEAA
jgi:hypothetical protein